MFIRVPSHAKSVTFDFAFFSTEFNEYWNSRFNDAFFALVTSKKIAGMNVAKDSKGLALTVNSGFFQLCPAPPVRGRRRRSEQEHPRHAQGHAAMVDNIRWEKAPPKVPTGEVERPPM
jgi:hypothetical protein